MNATQQDDDDQGITIADLNKETVDDNDVDDDEEDNMPLSLRIEALRSGNEDDEVAVNDVEMEVEVDDNSLLVVGDDGELDGIDDVDAYIDIAVEKTFCDIFEGISDKVDMEMTEEVVKALEDKEKVAASKLKTNKRRKPAKRSKARRKLIIKEDDNEEEVVAKVETP
ncbi:hypothetical protein Dimus_013672 [Dionaea muscipula]